MALCNSEPDLPKDFFVDGECEVQDVFYVVVLGPLKGLVELLIQILQITEVTWTASGKYQFRY